LYAVVAVRLEPKLDKHGRPERYASGLRAGEIKTRKVRFFRPPNERDLAALAEAERRLQANWERWDAEGLIPTERIPTGHKTSEPLRYGAERWCDLFTPRQLLGHLTLIEGLRRLTPQILSELGEERGQAVATYLQFAIDKGIDYNSRQTRWKFTRGVVKGTFGRHDFSLKWTFGEMIFTSPNSGAAWGLSQVVDAYKGMAELVEPVLKGTFGQPPVRVLKARRPTCRGSATDLSTWSAWTRLITTTCSMPSYRTTSTFGRSARSTSYIPACSHACSPTRRARRSPTRPGTGATPRPRRNTSG
jgi:adenine-specific DNA methylase